MAAGTSGAPTATHQPWTIDAGALVLENRRIVSGASGGFDVRFAGNGPVVVLGWHLAETDVEVETSYVSYDLSKDVFHPQTGPVSVGGGSTLRNTLRADDHLLTIGMLSITPLADLSFEDHAAHDVLGLGVLPSYARIAFEGGVDASVALGASLHAGLQGRLSPYSLWKESPAGTSGANPHGTTGFSGGVHLEWIHGPWTVGATGLYESQSVTFSGTAKAQVLPPITNAHVTETYLGGMLQAGVGF